MQTERRLVVPNEDEVAFEVLQGEAVLINLSTGHYYSLADQGAEVWAMISARTPVAEIAHAMAARYRAPVDDVLADVARLADELLAERLVREDDGPAGATPAEDTIAPPAEAGYKAPRLQKYSDMADMLALDPPLPGLKDIPWRAAPGE
jgi:Coenzyme PQQ synthesis protein D (PqqD)